MKNPSLQTSEVGLLRIEGGEKETSEIGSLAKRMLLSGLAASKEWATDLGVSDRAVRNWAIGVEKIPAQRVFKIVLTAKGYIQDFKDLEKEIDQIVYEQFGGKDPGTY